MSFPPEPVVLLVQATVEPEVEDEFNRWYTEDHLPEILSCPGFIQAARYKSSDAKPNTYLALYILDDEEALKTPELDRVRGFAHLSDHVSYESRTYRLLASVSTPSQE